MSRSISLFFSSRTSENARTFTRAISKTRDKISFLIQNRRSKNSAQKTASSVQRRTKSFARSKKIQKNSKRILQNRENNEKSKKKKKSVGKELDTSLCCAIDLVTALT